MADNFWPVGRPAKMRSTDTTGVHTPHVNVDLLAAPVRATTTATIANGASLSAAADLANDTLIGVYPPAANWTATVLSFQGSLDGSVYVEVLDPATGAGYATPSLAAGDGCSVDAMVFLPYRYIKVRSGTVAAPVAQAGGDVVTLVHRAI